MVVFRVADQPDRVVGQVGLAEPEEDPGLQVGRVDHEPRPVREVLQGRVAVQPAQLADHPVRDRDERKKRPGGNRGDVHLAIQDGMVSRQHAAVIRRHGVHYLKDLGSTHGITYKGMRIDTKRIDEGDVFTLGDAELRFTYLLE